MKSQQDNRLDKLLCNEVVLDTPMLVEYLIVNRKALPEALT